MHETAVSMYRYVEPFDALRTHTRARAAGLERARQATAPRAAHQRRSGNNALLADSILTRQCEQPSAGSVHVSTKPPRRRGNGSAEAGKGSIQTLRPR